MRWLSYVIGCIGLVMLVLLDEQKWARQQVSFQRAYRKRFARVFQTPVLGKFVLLLWSAVALGLGMACLISTHKLVFPWSALTLVFGLLSLLGGLEGIRVVLFRGAWEKFREAQVREDDVFTALLKRRPKLVKWGSVVLIAILMLWDLIGN